ncbi:hypothetical protein BDD12DRAFT_842458 [Trichophaea hybrida]|nr:hypothetical protein BDD12DRAFT_842458 [Trichophaea hybrida]
MPLVYPQAYLTPYLSLGINTRKSSASHSPTKPKCASLSSPSFCTFPALSYPSRARLLTWKGHYHRSPRFRGAYRRTVLSHWLRIHTQGRVGSPIRMRL